MPGTFLFYLHNISFFRIIQKYIILNPKYKWAAATFRAHTIKDFNLYKNTMNVFLILNLMWFNEILDP